jgi:hypothetical protein
MNLDLSFVVGHVLASDMVVLYIKPALSLIELAKSNGDRLIDLLSSANKPKTCPIYTPVTQGP